MAGKLNLAVSGKGGVGKTTVSALLTKFMVQEGKVREGDLLVVDADPDSNMPDVLGVKQFKTVGEVSLDLKKKIEKGRLAPTQNKAAILESGIFAALEELDDFDLLVMGRAEGEGCYCYINSQLVHILDTLSKNYKITLMDTAAGLEHLSRRTDRDVDSLVVVSDASKMGIQTAERIVALSKEVHLDFRKIWVIGNRFPASSEKYLEQVTENIRASGDDRVELLGFLPMNETIAEYNLTGQNLLDLPADNPMYATFKAFAGRIVA